MKPPFDIVMLALPPWDGPYSSTAFSLAKELSKANRVFYIDNPLTLKDLFVKGRGAEVRKRINALIFGKNACTALDADKQKLYAITPPVTLPINFLPEGFLYSMLSKLNDRLLFHALRKTFEKFGVHDFIFINVFNPFYALEFPDFFRPKLFVYYSVDNIKQSPYVRRHGLRLEGEAMRKAGVSLAASRELLRQASRKTNRAYYLPNAADISLFSRKATHFRERPSEFGSIRTPIIIFTGNIDHRIDFDLIRNILENYPDKTLVMIGPISISKELELELSTYPNLRFLGRRHLWELPMYLNFSQCAIIPYVCSELTNCMYPLNLNEYLAAGLPVISTAFSDDIEAFQEVIEISESSIDFCYKISVAIDEDSAEKKQMRIKAVLNNNWESRVNEFWTIVNTTSIKEQALQA